MYPAGDKKRDVYDRFNPRGYRTETGMSLEATHMTFEDFDDTKWQEDLWTDWSFWNDGDWPLDPAWNLSPDVGSP
jgi:hypothetical protein